jgi:hypothetical protein
MAKQDKTIWVLIAGAAAAAIYFATRPKQTVPVSNVPLQQKYLPAVQQASTELGINDILNSISSGPVSTNAPALTINPAEAPALQPMSLDIETQPDSSAGITNDSNYEA